MDAEKPQVAKLLRLHRSMCLRSFTPMRLGSDGSCCRAMKPMVVSWPRHPVAGSLKKGRLMTRFTPDEFLAHLSRRMFLAAPPAANPLVATARVHARVRLGSIIPPDNAAESNRCRRQFQNLTVYTESCSRDISPRMSYPSCGRRSD